MDDCLVPHVKLKLVHIVVCKYNQMNTFGYVYNIGIHIFKNGKIHPLFVINCH